VHHVTIVSVVELSLLMSRPATQQVWNRYCRDAIDV
jgi:hypothetical protein